MNIDKIDILSLRLPELEKVLVENGEKRFRAKQVYDWLHAKRVTSFDQMTNLSAQAIKKYDQFFWVKSLNIRKRLVSKLDDTVKYLYVLPDGEMVETVLMKYKHGNSLCISTQVGCKMNCDFCASAKAGFIRNLTPSEMLLQIYETERDANLTIQNLVLMGIGEPLDNYDNVLQFLMILSDNNFSLRRVSISTCGLVDKIKDLADKKLGVTLSVSLHATNDEQRSAIMPINKRYNLKSLLDACDYYFKATGRRISFEFALIQGVNDDYKTAMELVRLVRPLSCHVNLIPVNQIRESEYLPPLKKDEFQKILLQNGINATIRRTLGADIDAACGQLRRDHL